jgi:alpha-L-fucosidase 2
MVNALNLAKDMTIRDNINWPSFLARHDLIWKTVPMNWMEAPFTGNGQLGAMIFAPAKKDEHGLRWHIGRSDVAINGLWGGPQRVPIGDLVLKTDGKILACNMRQDLWNAEVTGTLKTDKGSIAFSSFTHTSHMVQIMELRVDGDEKAPELIWESPDFATCSFWTCPDYIKNPSCPPPVQTREGNFQVHTQKLANDSGEFAVVWCVVPGKAGTFLVYLDVGYSQQEGAAKKEALDAVKGAMAAGMENLRASHRVWWHDYYPASFLSIPDARLESFYWIQMYRMASSTRADRVPMDNIGGPWCPIGGAPWMHIHWDLNIQLIHWPMMGANRLEMGEAFYRMLDKNVDNLVKNTGAYASDSAGIAIESGYNCVSGRFPNLKTGTDHPDGAYAPFLLGALPWAMHNYWLQYRHSLDDDRLRKNLFPLLKRSINLYVHHLKTGSDGKLHIEKGASPEYDYDYHEDTSFDLALLRWGCTTLLEIDRRLDLKDPLVPTWRRVLDNLPPYPIDGNGLMVAAGVAFAQSHRHFSHLLAFYPLYLLNPERANDTELLTRSLAHWTRLLKGGDETTPSTTGAASMLAALGRGDEALKFMKGYRNVTPNAMEIEAGTPLSEGVMSAAQSVHDMVFSSWGGTIRIFPGLPAIWKEVVFHNMRTEGAFLISAARKDGTTQWVRVKSLAGEPCRIRPSLPGKVCARVSGKDVLLNPTENGVYTLPLAKGEEAILYSADKEPYAVVTPLPQDAKECNSWGGKR